MWSLELTCELFHGFFAYYFNGGGTIRTEFNPPLQGGIFRKNPVTSGWRGIWHPRRGQFSHEERALWSEGICDRNRVENASLLPLFFLLRQLSPSLLDRKSSKLLHQSPNPNLPLRNRSRLLWAAQKASQPHYFDHNHYCHKKDFCDISGTICGFIKCRVSYIL